MRFATTLAAGALLGAIGFGAVSASAAPAMPHAALVAGDTIETVRHRGHHHHSHMGHHGTTKHERMMRRHNTHHHGNPNARNPERPGYQQQLGNTTNGPRY
ncbi:MULTISPECIES: hypothetical protein [Methylobacterium]|uniref:Uncharacterized protein n=1 Tax=Methylobacterium thuringiense TaxID=1003091 RepID=A0ABQ4TGQ3_9HYPH|nr:MULTISPECIES: hypothetical protein [Methylobacterium]TXN19237.1 hypothetical protein FV217_22040 [Methylobacterium sp. WL9]GJE53979.1 hypothetical protein EKPJFOCH_0449 [Methylobacterium thuringiense]